MELVTNFFILVFLMALTAYIITDTIYKVKIYVHKESNKAAVPETAYRGTSAAFDITATETITIPAKKSAVVPNDLRLTINQTDPYYMFVQLRSSMGFKRDLVPHAGVIDAGYTGPLGIKIYNLGDEDVIIESGTKFAQILVLPKVPFKFKEINRQEFIALERAQKRGSKGFGSSGK